VGIIISALSLMLAGCGSGESGGGVSPPAPAPIDGAALYMDDCASCHGPLAISSIRGVTATDIQMVLSDTTGVMGTVPPLSTDQIKAIAKALATTPKNVQTSTPALLPASTSPPMWSLYNQYCSNCHGTLKQGRTAAQIQAAINSNIGGMGSLSLMPAAQITTLAAGQ